MCSDQNANSEKILLGSEKADDSVSEAHDWVCHLLGVAWPDQREMHDKYPYECRIAHERIDHAIEAAQTSSYCSKHKTHPAEGEPCWACANPFIEAVRREENAALKELADTAEAYMKYHTEKFYSDLGTKPIGLWPAINKARARISKEGK